MSVPLENLYDWLSTLSRDTLIYRFYPHGSKNLGDLNLLSKNYADLDTARALNMVSILCHDQEPLNFELFDLDLEATQSVMRTVWPQEHVACLSGELVQFLQKQNISMKACCFSLHDQCVLLHSELNSPEIEKLQSKDLVGAYYWSHAIIARDWYRFAKHDTRLDYQNCNFKYDFNFYCRAWGGSREYRLTLLDLCQQSDILKNSRVSFSKTDNGIDYYNHVWKNPALAISNTINLDTNDILSSASATYDVDHYNQCAIDVVTETLFDDNRWHLTEKILRPMACGKPFVLAATAGSLEYLKSYGFLTFGDIIDESYDSIHDPVKRLQAIVECLKSVNNLPSAIKNRVFTQLHAIAKYNQQVFFSQVFFDQVTNELQHNVNQAVKQVQLNATRGIKMQFVDSVLLPPAKQALWGKDITLRALI